ncbi:WD repeat-containing protein 44 [Branchiostoma belcheri]|nr:WD repeat-containing protein 44 [Branchiostoma belcheri]
MSSESDDEEFYDAKENISLTQSPAQRAQQAKKPELPQLSKKQEEQDELARQEEDRKAKEEEERKRKEEEDRKKKEQEELEKQLEENERRRKRLLAMRRQMEEEEEHAGDSPQPDETGSEETPVDTNPVQTSEEPPEATVDPEKPEEKDTSEECVPSPTPSPSPSPTPEAGDGFKTTKDISEMQADSEVETILEQRVEKEKENLQEILESPDKREEDAVDEPKPMTVEPDIVASTKPDIVAVTVSKERPGSLKVPPPRPPPPVAPPRRQKKKSANETPENEAQETPTKSSLIEGEKEEPKGLLTPTSEAIESLTKELERSLDMKGATSGSTLVKIQCGGIHSTHIGNIVNKASKTLGFLRRNLKACPKRIREIAYFTLVRPIVEFASPVWDPHIVKDINRLEQVQRRAARWVSQRFRRTSSVNNMLEELQWIPLRERRRLARLTTFYKYHTGALCINMQTRPTPNVQTRATRQSHSAAYRVPQSRTSYRQNSFFPRTIPDWNTLDADIALSPSLEEFRGKLRARPDCNSHDDESTKAEPTPPTSPADSKAEPSFKPAEEPAAGEKENPALPRLRSASGRPLTDEEILEQVMIKNLDTGELVPLSQAEDKLPKCMNPLSLHIIRRTKEYVSNNSLNKDDSDTESVEGQADRGKTMHQAEEKLKKGTKQLKKLFGKAVEKSVSKIKEIKDEVFAGEDSSSSDDETDTRTIKIKSSSSNKGPYEFDQLRLVQDLSGEHTRVWVLKGAYGYFDEMRHKYAMEARASPSPSQESVNSQNSQNSEPGSTTESPAHSQTGSGTPSEEPVEHEGPFRQIPFCSYRGHTADVLDLSWSKNYFILSSSMDKTVRLWHISRRECLCCFQHIDFVTAIAFHPRDDRYFLSGSLDGKLRLWNIPDKKVALWNELDGDIKLITAANFCENGRFAVVGTYDGRCIFFDTEHLKYFTQIHVRSTRGKNSKGRKITGIEQLPGEHKILVTSNDSRVRLYDLRDLSLSCKYKGGTNTSSQIKASLSYNGKFIVCGSEDHYIYIWKTYYDYSKFTSVRRDRNDFWEAFRAHTAVVTAAIFASNPTAIFSSMETQSSANQEKEGASKPEPGEVLVSADFSGAVKVFVNRAAKAKQQRVSEVQAPMPTAVAPPSEAKPTEQDTTAKENAGAVQTSKAPPKPPRASVKGPPPSRPPPPVRPPPPAVQKASS